MSVRKLIAGMQTSVDGKIEGPDGYADWVEGWGDNYQLMPQIDACLLGGGMYPSHEQYWTALEETEEPKVAVGLRPPELVHLFREVVGERRDPARRPPGAVPV